MGATSVRQALQGQTEVQAQQLHHRVEVKLLGVGEKLMHEVWCISRRFGILVCLCGVGIGTASGGFSRFFLQFQISMKLAFYQSSLLDVSRQQLREGEVWGAGWR